MTTAEMNKIYFEQIHQNRRHPCVGDYSSEELIKYQHDILKHLDDKQMVKEFKVVDAVFTLAIELRKETEKLKEYYDKQFSNRTRSQSINKF